MLINLQIRGAARDRGKGSRARSDLAQLRRVSICKCAADAAEFVCCCCEGVAVMFAPMHEMMLDGVLRAM